MINYQNGKIYRIVCNITGKQYIGSTAEPTLARRLSKHVGYYKYHLKGKGNNMTSFKILENNDYAIILIENYPCNNKDELHKRERYFIESMDCVNIIIPFREKNETDKLKYKNNKEIILNKRRDYYVKNSEAIKKRVQEYAEKNKDKIAMKIECACGGHYTHTHKHRHEQSFKHLFFNKKLK